MGDKPIWSAVSLNFGDVHHARQDVPHASGHVCKVTTFETFLELGSIDPALPGCLQQPLASALAQMATYKDFSTTPAPSAALCAAWPPQPLHALRPSQVTILITHALTHPRLAFSIARLPV
jgi:hypothetical protein